MISTLDFSLFRLSQDLVPQVLVLEREDKDKPFYGEKSLVGGFIFEEEFFEGQQIDEDDVEATTRILTTKIGYVPDFIIPCGRKGSRTRDPRGWSMTYIHSCPIHSDKLINHADAHKFSWVDVQDILSGEFSLMSDHMELVGMAWAQLKRTAAYSTAPLYLLPDSFTIKQIIEALDTLGLKVSKQGVMSRFLDGGLIEETGEKVSLKGVKNAGPRPKLYRLSASEPAFFNRTIG